MNAPKVVIRRGEAVDEYPLPLPIEPTYREMNLMENAIERPVGLILMFAGVSPTYDVAVAIYAMARERGREFTGADSEDLLDLPMGAIEVVYADAVEVVPDETPLPVSGDSASRSDSAADKPIDSPPSTSETLEDSGTP